MPAQNFTGLPPAIVCNCHYNGLAIIQELGRRGITCIAADCRREIGTFSRYTKYANVPSPVTDENGFIEGIIDICRSLKQKPVIFPTNDEWAMALARHRDRLEDHALPLVSEFHSIQQVLDKRIFYRFGNINSYPTPKILEPETGLEHYHGLNFPVAIKPAIRRFSSGTYDNSFTFPDQLRFNIINNSDDLAAFLERWKEYLSYLFVTEYIPGMSDTNITIGVYSDRNYEVQRIFTSRKVRGYPANNGTWVMAKTEPVPDRLIQMCHRLCKELKLFGILEIEFKQHSETGEYYLIEINPRSWAFIGLTSLSGVNLPLFAYQDVTGIKLEEISSKQTEELYFGKITEDFINCTIRYKSEFPDWHMSVRRWLTFFRTHETYSAEFHYPDYPVWGVAMIKTLRTLWKALFGK